MFFENENIKFDYMNEKLTIKPEYDIFSKEIKKVEKISFDIIDESHTVVTHSVIMIETISKHCCGSSYLNLSSEYYYLSYMTEKEYDNILLVIANNAGKYRKIIDNRDSCAKDWLYLKLLRDAESRYGFEYRCSDLDPFKLNLSRAYFHCFWICNFIKEDFQSIFDSIVNCFSRDKIEETKKILISSNAMEKSTELIDIYGIDFSNKEEALNNYAEEIKKAFNKNGYKHAEETYRNSLLNLKADLEYWNNAKEIEGIDTSWCEQYIKVLSEKGALVRKIYTDFVRNNNEAVLKQKQIASEIGDDFENEEFIIYQYKKNIGQKLFSINATFDELSKLLETEINSLCVEREFWQTQLNENEYVDKNWTEKYISVINCKCIELRSSFNEYIIDNNEELLNDIKKVDMDSSKNYSIPHFDPKSSLSSIEEMVSALNKEGENYDRRNNFYNDVVKKMYSDSDAKDEYGILLDLKINALKAKYLKSMENVCGKISSKKLDLLEQLSTIDFMQGVELYKEYVKFSEYFYGIIRENTCKIYCDTNCLYYEYYYHGSILISNQLNILNKKASGKKHISESDLNNALMYFYDSYSIEEAKEKQRARDYLGNKKNGLIGENEVNYALKWLDKGYTKIARKDPEKPISLYNPNFIDEAQEYDHIIVGKQGVFNIETKNYSGKLIVDANGNWIRIKKDGTQEGERNPIQQLRRHEKLLRSIIGSDVPIINIICMAHPKMIIEGVENCSIPLVKSDLLVEFIETYKSDVSLSDDEISECIKKIESYMN